MGLVHFQFQGFLLSLLCFGESLLCFFIGLLIVERTLTLPLSTLNAVVELVDAEMFEVDILVFGVEHLVDLLIDLFLLAECLDIGIKSIVERLITIIYVANSLCSFINKEYLPRISGTGGELTFNLTTHQFLIDIIYATGYPLTILICMLCTEKIVLIYALNAQRTGSGFYLSLSCNAVHAVIAVLLSTIVLALLVGFLLLHHLYHLGIGLGQVNGRLDFDTKVVEIILIIGLELLNHRHALSLGDSSIVQSLFKCIQRLHYILDILLRLGKRLLQITLMLGLTLGSLLRSRCEVP